MRDVFLRPVIAVPFIITINIAVFIAWYVSQVGDPDLIFMRDNFLVSWDGLAEGRYWTLLTSAFSHNMFLHIFINMYVLQSFGSILEKLLGFTRFIRLYLFAALVGSISHCVVSKFLLEEPQLPALGASGAIAGLILVFSLLFPRQKIYLLGVIPLSAIWGAFAFIGLDLWGLWSQVQGGGLPIGHGAHLGGALGGFLYYLRLRHRFRQPWA